MSSENLLTKFDQLAQQFHDIVQEEKAKLHAKIEVVNDNDIIHLNIGGRKLTTKRSTLCQVKDSHLAKIFSGSGEDSPERDEDGTIFFDFNPQYFILILDYLRAKKIAISGTSIPLPEVAEDQFEYFNILLQHLGLSNEIIPTEIAPSEKFDEDSPGVTFEERGTVAFNQGSSSRYIFGENIYEKRMKMSVKLKLVSFRKNHLFVGVRRAHLQSPQRSGLGTGSYGWVLGRGGICKDGSLTIDIALQNRTEENDMVELVLDCYSCDLTLKLPKCQPYHIKLPKSPTWKLHVQLEENDKVRIMND